MARISVLGGMLSLWTWGGAGSADAQEATRPDLGLDAARTEAPRLAAPGWTRSRGVPEAFPDVPRLHIVQLGPGAGAAATSGWFRAFEQAGVRVLQPIPPRAFAVHGPRSSLERLRDVLPIAWIGPFDPRWKIQPRLAELLVAREKNRRGDASSAIPPKADVVVQCFAGLGVSLGAEEARPDVLPALAAAGLRPRWISRVRNRWHLRLDAPLDLIPAIARWDSVFRVELFPEYRLFGERENVASAGAYADTATCVGPGYREWLAKKGANGRGVIVQVQDDGIEQGDATGRAGTAHPDLLGTIAGVDNATSDVLGDSGAGHGSINAGIVAGTGATGWTDASGFEPGLGIAPEAQVFGTKIFANNSRFDVNSRSFSDLAAAAVAAGCSVSSNSWGALFPGDYDFAAAEFDALARDAHPAPGQQPLTLVFSAGNAGDFFEDSLGTVGSPAIAKNVISVGAGESCDADGTDGCEVDATGADSVRDLIAFSSRGPLADGRLGVTVLAPGTHVAGVASTAANYDGTGVCDKYWPEGQTLYARSSGTSHSAPQVAGAAALFLDKIARESGELPSPALVRAAIAGSARDRAGGSDGFGGVLPPRPDPQQGWGSLKIDELIDDEAGLPKSLHFDGPAVFTESGQEWEAIVFVIDPAKPLRVALAWTDPPAMPGANPALVNDLDLEVDVGGVTYVGNVFSGGFSTEGGEPDRLNNLECVFVEQPSGSAIVRVRAANIQGDGIPGNFARVDQDFAVSVFGATDQSSAGAVTLRGNAFSCSAKAGLLVSDKDLQGAGTVQVTVTSTSQPAGAAVTLQETKAGSGVFQGEAALGSGQGQIAVAHGDTLTAIYRDANDGTGRQVERQATAPVDCQGPSVRNVEVVDVTDTAATIRFETDEDSRATIRHGDACDALSDTTDARVFARTHEVQLAGLRPGTRHVFGIDAADRVDNITVDRRAGQCWFFTTGVRSCALNDDLEPGPEPGWTHAALAGVDDWGVQLVPGTHSESHAFLTTSTDGIKDAVLVFPPLDIAPGDHLAFWHGVFLEDGYDGGVLEVSTDGGQTWEDAGSGLEQGGYVGPIEDGPLGGRNAWTGVIGLAGPVEVVADLTAWAGAARQLRFRISCDESFGDGAWIIDDVSVCHFINKRGQLSASRDVAHCASAVTLQLEDLDLQGAGAATVEATPRPGAPVVRLTLSEVRPPSGIFAGQIVFGAGPGRLAVQDGDVVVVKYTDADSGDSGNDAESRVEIRIDCTPPSIRGVHVAEIIADTATITWETSEPTSGRVVAGLVCGGSEVSASTEMPGTSHSVTLRGLADATMYWISVETMDPAGNTSIENFGGACKGILPIELCTFAEDFDGPFGGWSHAADAGTDTWRVASFPDARTPPSAWFVEDSDRLADSALATPPFLVPPGSFLLFWHTFALESGFDGAVIEISVDGGQKWEDLGPRITAGGYNGTVGGSNPLGERRVWTGGAIGPMRQVLVTLEEFAGKLAQIRFRIGCDGSFGGDGWYVDDVRICKSVRERGALSFDRFAYPCRSDVVVEVSDTGLLAGPLTVRVTSTSERAGEAIQLIETPAGSRRFLASLPISTIDGPGVLRVASGDTIQAVYSDADDGSGHAAQLTASAVIDCEPPRISDVSISDATESSAQVSWRTDSATTGTVEVGTTCGAVAQSVESGFPAMEHRVRILGLEPGTLYYARIRAADAAGNSTVDDAAGACFPFRTSVAFCTFEDDLEPKPQDGWRFDPSIWSAATTPLAHSRTHAWSLRTSPGPMNATLVLPALRPETSTRLEFWHNLETPEGESGGVLEVSRDGGATWSDLGSKITDGGGYTGPILVDLEGQELVEGWTGGVAGPLTRVSLSLDDFAGERILVRFRFISSGLLELPKRWLIDDVRVCGLSGETGRIGFSRPAYPCEASVIVTVSDASLTGRGSVDVDVTSTHQTLPERLTLIERSAGSFRGNIALYDSAVPGLLYAESGDSIRAVYRDERNADGAASTAEAFSKVDCDPPRLDGVQVEGAGGRAVRVSWRADEPVEGSLAFGDSCGRTSRILPASPFGTRPSALLTNLDTNEQVFFKVSAVDDAGNSAVEDAGGRCYTFQIDSTCGFRDTLEPPAAGWTHAAAQGQDRWSVAVLGAAHSPTHAWFGPDSAQPLDAWLVTPPFDVEGSSELQFWHTFALESGLDGAVLEISTDSQKSWTDIGGLATEGSYNGFIFGAGDFRQAWTGGDIGAMTRVSVPLGEFAGTGRQVRFRIVCDQGFNVRGWFIDDVAVCTSALGGVAASFARGNCAADAKIDIADAIFLLGHLFLGGREPACSQACDANADGALNLTDAVFLLHHLFIGGAAPEPPERCGAVLSSSVLDCAADACVSR